MIDPVADSIIQQSQRTIEDHLTDYESKRRAAGRDAKHIGSTLSYVRAVARSAGFVTAGEITADGVSAFANTLTDDGRSARTIQAYLTAIRSFTRWLAAGGKLPRDPLTSIRKPSPKTDRRRERRMLLPEERRRLERATLAGPIRCGMTGPERRLLYRTAIETGLRAGELRSLTRGSLHLDDDPPYVTCRARSTKNHQDARQYIQPDLAAELRAHAAVKSPKAPVFAMSRTARLAEMLQADLADARKAWLQEALTDADEYIGRESSDFLSATNDAGQVLDFHSLRHTCGAWLAIRGEHPKTIQSVMRHSSITLTMDTYGHLLPGQEAGAVSRMAPMFDVGVESLRASQKRCQVPFPRPKPGIGE